MTIEMTTEHPAYRAARSATATWRADWRALVQAQSKVDDLYERYAGDDEPADLTPEQSAEVEAMAERLGVSRLRATEETSRDRVVESYERFIVACGASDEQVRALRDLYSTGGIALALKVADLVEAA